MRIIHTHEPRMICRGPKKGLVPVGPAVHYWLVEAASGELLAAYSQADGGFAAAEAFVANRPKSFRQVVDAARKSVRKRP